MDIRARKVYVFVALLICFFHRRRDFTMKAWKLLAACVLLVTSSFGMVHAQSESKSDEYGFKVVTADSRWSHNPQAGATYFGVTLNDSKRQANGYVVGVKRSQIPGNPQVVRDWLLDTVMKNHLTTYTEGYPHSRPSDSEMKVKLADGTEVLAFHREVSINGNPRSLFFAGWERQVNGEKIWYFARFTNAGTYHKLAGSSVLNELLAGIVPLKPEVVSLSSP